MAKINEIEPIDDDDVIEWLPTLNPCDEDEKRDDVEKVENLMKKLEALPANKHKNMLTVAITPDGKISHLTKLLSDELTNVSNVKSRSLRLLMLSTITSTIQKLSKYNIVPDNGLILFCGLTDENNRIAIDFTPHKPVRHSLYCYDTKFNLRPLQELLVDPVTYFAIRSGHRTGICVDTDALIMSTAGHPNVEYGSFESIEEADTYLCTYIDVTQRASPPIPKNTVYYEAFTMIYKSEATEDKKEVQKDQHFSGFALFFGCNNAMNRLESIPEECTHEAVEIMGFMKLLEQTKEMTEDLTVITSCSYLLQGLEFTSKLRDSEEEWNNFCSLKTLTKEQQTNIDNFKPFKTLFGNIHKLMDERKSEIRFKPSQKMFGFYGVRMAHHWSRRMANNIANQMLNQHAKPVVDEKKDNQAKLKNLIKSKKH